MTNPAAQLPPRAAAGPAVGEEPAPVRRANRGAWELYGEVLAALDKMGPELERSDVCRARWVKLPQADATGSPEP